MWLDSVIVIVEIVLPELPSCYSTICVKYGYHENVLPKNNLKARITLSFLCQEKKHKLAFIWRLRKNVWHEWPELCCIGN